MEIYFLRGDDNDRLRLYIMSGAPDFQDLLNYEFAYSVPQNEWHHLVLQRQGTNIKLFVDGGVQ